MRTALGIAFVWIAATAFFFTIIGVFGLEIAVMSLILYIAIAGVLALRRQPGSDRP